MTDEPQDAAGPQGADSPQGAEVPQSLPRRPVHLGVAAGVVGLETLALLGIAVAFVVLATTGGEVGTSLLALGAMFAILGACMVAVTRSLWLMHRWARPAAIAWQVLQALFGISTFQAGPLLGLAAIVPAVVFLYAIFQPRVIYAFEDALAYYEAHPSAPAPPPKRW
ncbi:MAG TPA: hypothetical protein H9793_06595 [Candidatus Brevibacterium intestinigallinarum]|nr:hypothetical protein [Candidatus Brevibacterium intestinigallinarum]